jgi:hypothetical protein
MATPGSGSNAAANAGIHLRWPACAVVALALLLVAAACDGGDGGRAGAIVCSTAYRVSQSEPLTEVDHLRFEDEDSVQSLPYIYLELHGEYRTGRVDGERSLRLWVTPTGEEKVLLTQLYQLPEDSGPQDQFVGDHGFTGLTYAYDPVSGAELQYWCAAE